jgi:hypothetical protein
MSIYRPGVKVVCVIDSWISPTALNRPVKGTVYTIRDVEESGIGLFLRFVEIENPSYEYREGIIEASFQALAFRPVAERKTDISIFKAMLNRPRLGVSA